MTQHQTLHAPEVHDLDPTLIEDHRDPVRLSLDDLDDLRASIATHGQVAPILVRPRPGKPGHYLLVYGLRRLEAVRQLDHQSNTVQTVRALVQTMDAATAAQAQHCENAGRRDLTYIERARHAFGLIREERGSQTQVAAALNVSKSWVSTARSILEVVGCELVRLIGPAPGIGRPRWEALARTIASNDRPLTALWAVAKDARAKLDKRRGSGVTPQDDPSVTIFEAVEKAAKGPRRRYVVPHQTTVRIQGDLAARLRRTAHGVAIDFTNPFFANWVQSSAQSIVEDLHTRWLKARKR